MRAEITLVIPVYNCARYIEELHGRAVASLSRIGAESRFVFVDDGSGDDSWTVLRALAERDSNVACLRLSRNFGQHAAVTAGLAYSATAWTAIMNCDLEDPPEEIPSLFAKAAEGYDIVFGRRVRHRRGLARRALGRVYIWLLNTLTGAGMATEPASLVVVSARVAKAFLALRERDRQYELILHWLGFRQATVEIRADAKNARSSKHSVGKLLRVGLDGIFFHPAALLPWVLALGALLITLGAIVGLSSAIGSSVGQAASILAALILSVGGLAIMSIGLIGLYVGRIFAEAKGRPLYVIDEVIGER